MNKNIHQIFVDLDGTLIRTDLFFETAIKLIKHNPLNIFRLVLWILRGRSIAKDRVAQRVELNVEDLPYETSLVDYLREKKRQGHRIVLATASHRIYAEKIADHLDLFDQVIASDSRRNLKGVKKLAAIRECIGAAAFVYAGDSAADRPIWKEASANIFINAPARDVKKAEIHGKAEKTIIRDHSLIKSFIKEMRIHQWAKNALIFVPLFTSHTYQDLNHLLIAGIAFISFSFCASGVYFLNDLLDLDADRRHASKRFRPLASGALPIQAGLLGAIGLPLAAFILAWQFLPLSFFSVLALYFFTTNAYSFFLKSISTADVMTLAILYTLRVIAGAAAAGVQLSSWLMAFSIFIFVSLAYLKRYIEVAALDQNTEKVPGRGYSAGDSETLFSLGAASATASVLVLALYIQSDEVTRLYHNPDILWALCLIILYWNNRIWLGARRGKISGDPVIFAIKDNVSRALGLAFVAVILLARHVVY